MSNAYKSQPHSESRSIMITKRSYNNKKVKLTAASPGKEKYVPLSHLDKIKLSNHIDHIMQAFIEQVKTLPFARHEMNQEQDALLTVPEKQRVIQQLEYYRQQLLKGNNLRKPGRQTTVSLKDLRQDPVNTNAYFKLREQNSDMLKVFYEMDRPIRVAVSFMSQQQIIN